MKQFYLPRLAALLVAGVLPCGCATISSATSQQATLISGAAPLDPTNVRYIGKDEGGNAISRKQGLLNAIADSYANCSAYKRRLILGSRGADAGFDIATTALSTIASVVSPVAIVHALTAATAFSSSSKSAVDADLFENATAALMVKSLQKTYDAQMLTLQGKIEEEMLSPIEDLSDVVRINQLCSFTESLANIEASPSPAPAATPPP